MIEYINYKGRKLPFCITMGALVEFKKATGVDFELAIIGSDIEKIYEYMLLITILGIQKGFKMEQPSFIKKIVNLITKGNIIGLSNKDYLLIMDLSYNEITQLFPKFFGMLSEEDKKK